MMHQLDFLALDNVMLQSPNRDKKLTFPVFVDRVLENTFRQHETR
jgi:hypothetical protein